MVLCQCSPSKRLLQIEKTKVDINPSFENIEAVSDALRGLVEKFPKSIKRADNHVHIALPDPMFRQTDFTLDQLPRSKSERDALVAWRHADSLNIEPTNLTVGYQIFKRDKSKTSVLAQSLGSKLTISVGDLFSKVGLVPTQISSTSAYEKPNAESAQFWSYDGWWCFQRNPQSACFASWSDGTDDAQIASRIHRVLVADEAAPSTLRFHSNRAKLRELLGVKLDPLSISVQGSAQGTFEALCKQVAIA